jgi:phage gpG-like protein
VASKITIEVQAAQVELALKSYARPAKVTEALARLGRVIVNRIKLGFRSGIDPYGLPWLAPVLRKGQPLVDTGRLRSSISSRVIGQEVEVGTNLIYAPIHQFGGLITAKNAPYLVFPYGGSAAGSAPQGYLRKKSVYIPQRRFFPINSAGQVELPGPWAVSALAGMAAALRL